MKRAFDMLAVLATFPLWLPLLGAVALAVLIIDGRPVFFRQRRAGLREVPFTLCKFRTMRAGSGPDVQRVTRLGRFLRKTSLDELPELLLVMTGTMSLVGPRPLPVEYLPRYTAEQHRRHAVRPGITGLAQVNGRNETTWARRLAYDVWYAGHASCGLDLKILFKTVAVVFSARGVDRDASTTMPAFAGRGAS